MDRGTALVVVVLVFGLFLSAMAGGIAWAMIGARRRRARTARPIAGPGGAVDIPIMAAALGRPYRPWELYSRSDLPETFSLLPAALRFRVIRTGERPYGEIAEVDARRRGRHADLFVAFASGRPFSARCANQACAAAALAILAAKGCRLTERARQMAAEASGPPP